MYDDILIPTDGTDAATTAAGVAIDLADRLDSTVHVLHVVSMSEIPPGLREEAKEFLQSDAEQAVTKIVEYALDEGVPVESYIEETIDPTHTTILDVADKLDVDLISMGTRARSGPSRFAIGSVARRTLRHASMPVLTIHEDARDIDAIESILLPTDGSVGAKAATSHAVDLCHHLNASLDVVNVVDTGTLDRHVRTANLLEAFQELGQAAVDEAIDMATRGEVRSVKASVLEGTPARSIVDFADAHDIDLITIGTHGRTGLDRVLLGSVAERVIGRANVPVLAVKAETDGT